MAKKLETKLSYAIAEYLSLQYPKVVFRFDVGGDIRVTIGTARILKTKLLHKRGFQDLSIFEPKGAYCGLLIELKKNRGEVYRKDGSLKKRFNKGTNSDHNIEQQNHLAMMREKGYMACYGFGFDKTKEVIDKYMSLSEMEMMPVGLLNKCT